MAQDGLGLSWSTVMCHTSVSILAELLAGNHLCINAISLCLSMRKLPQLGWGQAHHGKMSNWRFQLLFPLPGLTCTMAASDTCCNLAYLHLVHKVVSLFFWFLNVVSHM